MEQHSKKNENATMTNVSAMSMPGDTMETLAELKMRTLLKQEQLQAEILKMEKLSEDVSIMEAAVSKLQAEKESLTVQEAYDADVLRHLETIYHENARELADLDHSMEMLIKLAEEKKAAMAKMNAEAVRGFLRLGSDNLDMISLMTDSPDQLYKNLEQDLAILKQKRDELNAEHENCNHQIGYLEKLNEERRVLEQQLSSIQ